MRPTEDQMKRLPTYVRDYIRKLEGDVQSLGDLLKYSDEEGYTCIVSNGHYKRKIKSETGVQCLTKDRSRYMTVSQVSDRTSPIGNPDRSLRIIGSDALTIFPCASNTFVVEFP